MKIYLSMLYIFFQYIFFSIKVEKGFSLIVFFFSFFQEIIIDLTQENDETCNKYLVSPPPTRTDDPFHIISSFYNTPNFNWCDYPLSPINVNEYDDPPPIIDLTNYPVSPVSVNHTLEFSVDHTTRFCLFFYITWISY